MTYKLTPEIKPDGKFQFCTYLLVQDMFDNDYQFRDKMIPAMREGHMKQMEEQLGKIFPGIVKIVRPRKEE